MNEWLYKSKDISSTGYEDVIEELKSYNRSEFLTKTKEDQDKIVERIFNIYRNYNIYPITYYNEEGILLEIQKCIDKTVVFDSNCLNFSFNQGSSLCRFLFPNMLNVEVGGDKRTPVAKFYSDHNLKRAIEFCLKHKTSRTPVVPSGIRDGISMLGGGVATNFKPMTAKAIYENYCPQNGIIYDFSCGFGGRMLGALTSKNNYKYFGVEPDTKTYSSLKKLGLYIEKATNRENIFKIYNKCSEDFSLCAECADFAFSSPPYFNLEKYSDEETQCYNKYTDLQLWFDNYMKPTIKNIHTILKSDCYYAVNISDFKIGNKEIALVDKWIEASQEVGFDYIENIPMALQTRRGVGHEKGNKKTKLEGVFVFKKNIADKEIVLHDE